jgi:hypothetical protein
MNQIQKLIPIFTRLLYALAILFVCKFLHSYYTHQILQLRQSTIILLVVVITFVMIKSIIWSVRMYVGGSPHKSNCPITIINKTKQGKWLDKLHLVKRSKRAILICIIILIVFVYVMTQAVSYFWYL